LPDSEIQSPCSGWSGLLSRGVEGRCLAFAGGRWSVNSVKAAGIPRKLARTIGITVDPRRQNLSEESLKANVARLKEYQSRLILFPRRIGKHKKSDASAEDVKKAKSGEKVLERVALGIPIVNEPVIDEAKIKDVKGEDAAYRKLRLARSDARLVGVREKRAKAKAEEAESKKK
jgi:large subunit ribosomal protein L13e